MPISRKTFSKKRVKKSVKKILESTRKEHLVVNIGNVENDSVFLVVTQ